MHILVVGSGGLGCYLAYMFSKSGAHVSLIARGGNLEATRQNGLAFQHNDDIEFESNIRVFSGASEFSSSNHHSPPVLIFLTTKMYDLEQATQEWSQVVDPNAVFTTVQNGVQANEIVARFVGKKQQLDCVCYVSVTLDRPGHIRLVGQHARLLLGGKDEHAQKVAARLVDICDGSDMDVLMSDQIDEEIWRKFVFFAAVSGVTSICRQPLGKIRDNEVGRDVLTAAVSEVVDVAHAMGVKLEKSLVKETLELIDRKSETLKPSLLVDLEQGRRLEIEWISGAVHRLGRTAGIDTKVHSTICAALRPFENP